MAYLLLGIYYPVTQVEMKDGGSLCKNTKLGTETLHRARSLQSNT